MELPAELLKRIDDTITHYPQKRSAVMMLLHMIQEHAGHISREAIEWIAQKLELQPINVYEVVTFYPMYRMEPVGKYHIKVCRTLSCALGGGKELCRNLQKKLGVGLHETTQDGKFTIEEVECLASCGTAPVMMINDDFHEGVMPEKCDEILEKCV
ncbi:MAG: NADH-quinone oxidoreductase subunit NuoE [Verrucomicrobiae bacterium]|nr:NADH-quinone oxidoreductase subunit NuoE [Verrucomicrobiae bacterium]